jgi:hypothetical protein
MTNIGGAARRTNGKIAGNTRNSENEMTSLGSIFFIPARIAFCP